VGLKDEAIRVFFDVFRDCGEDSIQFDVQTGRRVMVKRVDTPLFYILHKAEDVDWTHFPLAKSLFQVAQVPDKLMHPGGGIVATRLLCMFF
jgi:hypothetical protein